MPVVASAGPAKKTSAAAAVKPAGKVVAKSGLPIRSSARPATSARRAAAPAHPSPSSSSSSSSSSASRTRAPATQRVSTQGSRAPKRANAGVPAQKQARAEPPAQPIKSALKKVRLDVKPNVKISWGGPDAPRPLEAVTVFETDSWINSQAPALHPRCQATPANFDVKFSDFSLQECRAAWGVVDSEGTRVLPTRKSAEELEREAAFDALYFPGNMARLLKWKTTMMSGRDGYSLYSSPYSATFQDIAARKFGREFRQSLDKLEFKYDTF